MKYVITLSEKEYLLLKVEMMDEDTGFRPMPQDEVTFVGLACALLAAELVED